MTSTLMASPPDEPDRRRRPSDHTARPKRHRTEQRDPVADPWREFYARQTERTDPT